MLKLYYQYLSSSALLMLKNISFFTLLMLLTPKANAQQPIANMLWGAPEAPVIIYLGMWSYHLHSTDGRQGNIRNDLIGISYSGFFAGTFINTFKERSYVAGIQRYWINAPLRESVEFNLGYRLGLMYGYGSKYAKQHFHICSPLLPLPQVICNLSWKHLGLQVSWTASILISTGFYIRF